MKTLKVIKIFEKSIIFSSSNDVFWETSLVIFLLFFRKYVFWFSNKACTIFLNDWINWVMHFGVRVTDFSDDEVHKNKLSNNNHS